MHEAVEGVRFVRSQPILLGAISLDLFAVLFGGAVALLPAIAENRLGVGAVGPRLAPRRDRRSARARHAVPHRSPGPPARRAHAARHGRPVRRRHDRLWVRRPTSSSRSSRLMVLSGADSVSVFIRSTLVPLVTPPDKRGRVLAVEAVFIGASNELGAFESGVVGQLLGRARRRSYLGGVAHARGCRAVVGSVPGAAQRRPVPRLGPALSDVSRGHATRGRRVLRDASRGTRPARTTASARVGRAVRRAGTQPARSRLGLRFAPGRLRRRRG